MPKISERGKPAIVFSDAKKTFKIKHTNSFKETFIAALQRKELTTDFNAVDGVSFDVPEGQSVALMGSNGSGKSTTLKLLSGVLAPDGGWVRTRGRIAGLIEVGAGFHPDLTGRQNVYLNAAILGMSKEETDAKFDDILEFSEIGEFIDTEVKRYSSGMYARLGFAVAVHTEFDVLLVDEVLSVGDAAFREKCNERMLQLRERGKTMFIVSHNAGQVLRLCERGIVLEHGRVIFDGPIEEAVDALERSQRGQGLVNDFPVLHPLSSVYDRNPSAYGAPLAPQQQLDSGVYQEFERGIISAFTGPGATNEAVGLPRGVFLSAYERAGGPRGPWGLLAGRPRGRFEDFETRAMPFENGIAWYSLDSGFSFARAGTEEFNSVREIYERED
ncbi:ATP-binding cassette domain-containing protein [Leucobacter chromiireducens]|uniref:ATP-binding cassette domain-containing protein n=1 Tax=Leucobacter chromiireducens subsp. chromiireducens TaxID=660067 RepID=A0ABS1SSL0_9MICO|nr:ATP-binding cassette domain-containing protein [Leucobacter chromiireducens subsp. chromiireducens]